ncbi:2-hydroxyacid dehydrogenase [Rhizobacter sp. P5_C2]
MSILLAADFDAAEWAAWLPALQAALPGETLWRAADWPDGDDVDIAIVANPPAGALQELPHLKLVQSLWAGVDKLLRDPTLPTGVPLARMVDPAMNAAMAETALWAALALQRGFFDYALQQRAGVWRQHGQRRADETRVAVLGLGQMGQAVAARLAQQGFVVSGWSTRSGPIDGVLRDADIVVSLLPLTSATTGFFDRERFAQMRRGASFVNLARGAQVIEADLLSALDDGQLAHAVLDVFATEPLPAEHPFWQHPKLTVLPHVAAQTDPRSAAQVVAANIRALRSGQPLQHLVDRTRGY